MNPHSAAHISHQPGGLFIAGELDQGGGNSWRQVAENGSSETKGQRKAHGADVYRHHFGKRRDHRAVIHVQEEREP